MKTIMFFGGGMENRSAQHHPNWKQAEHYRCQFFLAMATPVSVVQRENAEVDALKKTQRFGNVYRRMDVASLNAFMRIRFPMKQLSAR